MKRARSQDSPAPDGPDRKALKILFDTHWSGGGWLDQDKQRTPRKDLAYAKKAGMMFAPITVTHDDIIKMALSARKPVTARRVANAFVSSLTSRRLDLRSSLGSFAVVQHLPRHKLMRLDGSRECALCGTYDDKTCENLSVLNFERHKWGGVRHDQPLYAGFDLGLFNKLPAATPTKDDIQALRNIFTIIKSAPRWVSSAELEQGLRLAIKSNKDERDNVVAILGFCGILGTRSHPGYRTSFVPVTHRELPARRFVDMSYPACWWTRKDGLNKRAIDYWFGHLLKGKK